MGQEYIRESRMMMTPEQPLWPVFFDNFDDGMLWDETIDNASGFARLTREDAVSGKFSVYLDTGADTPLDNEDAYIEKKVPLQTGRFVILEFFVRGEIGAGAPSEVLVNLSLNEPNISDLYELKWTFANGDIDILTAIGVYTTVLNARVYASQDQWTRIALMIDTQQRFYKKVLANEDISADIDVIGVQSVVGATNPRYINVRLGIRNISEEQQIAMLDNILVYATDIDTFR